MSYILDALKKAESERSRDRLPDIHDPLAGGVRGRPRGRLWRSRALLWTSIGVAAGIVAAAVMQQVADRAAPTPPAAPPTVVDRAPATPAVASVAPPVPAQAPSLLQPPAAPLPPVQMSAPAPLDRAASATPFLPPPARPAAAASRTVDTVRSAVMAAPAARAARATSAASAASAPPAAVVALRDLPEAVRQQLPTLRLGGSIYSERRADRLLIVEGQLAREGDTVAPGLTLEQIGPRSAIFRQGALRFEMPL